MILSKGNLQVVQVAQDDKQITGLNNIHITKDGCTVALNKNTVIVISPVSDKIKKVIPLEETEIREAMTISAETIKEVIKNIPRDTMFKGLLEYCDVDKEGTFVITDGKRERKISGKKYDREFVDYKKFMKEGNITFRAVLNFKRLSTLFSVLNKICPDVVGESIVLLEFTDDNKVMLRATNMKNGQQVVIITTVYEYKESDWKNYFRHLTPIKIKRSSKIKKMK